MSNLTIHLAGYSRSWNGHKWGVTTPVAQLVTRLEDEATAKGVTLSRWQSSKAKWIVKVTYALHYGDRPAQPRYLPSGAMIAKVVINQREGKTERCEAYRKLSELFSALEGIEVYEQHILTLHDLYDQNGQIRQPHDLGR